MTPLQQLYSLADQCLDNRVDDGLQLIELCRTIPEQQLCNLKEILLIMDAAQETDYSITEVQLWPQRIMDELESLDPEYRYREDGENWEVFANLITGESEWKATVETELIANKLCALLNTPNPVDQK